MFDVKTSPKIERLAYEPFLKSGVEVYLQREDLIHPFISGNKWRKLKYVLLDAQSNGKNHLVSFGGAWSNHLVALACAGAMKKLKTTAFVRGDDVSNPMLGLCKLWGMHLNFVSRTDYHDKHALFNQYFGKDQQAYFIDEGGKGELGAKGCHEMLDQVLGFSHVICAVGTGTTLVGLTQSAHSKGMIAEGICVLKGAEAMDDEIKSWSGISVKIHHGYARKGYGKSDDELMAFIQDFTTSTSILIDQVYTGKMMMAIKTLIENGYYKKGDKLLLIHTGGLLGLMGVL